MGFWWGPACRDMQGPCKPGAAWGPLIIQASGPNSRQTGWRPCWLPGSMWVLPAAPSPAPSRLVLPMVSTGTRAQLGPVPCPVPYHSPPRGLRWLLWLHTGPPAAPHSLGQGGCSVDITREPRSAFLWCSVIYQPYVTSIWTSMLTGPHGAWCRAPGGLRPGQSGGAQSDRGNVCGPAWQCPQCP